MSHQDTSFDAYRLAATEHSGTAPLVVRSRGESTPAQRATSAESEMLFQASPLPMWVYDRKTFRFLNINDAAIACYGWTREEFLAMTQADLCPPETIFVPVEHDASASTGAGVRRHLKKDGTVLHAEVLSHDVYFEGREASLIVAHDVTERELAQTALRASESELRALLGAINDVILIISGEGRYLKIAPTSVELLCAPAEELLGRTFAEVFPPERAATFLRHVQTALREKQSVQVEYDLEINGETLWFDATISPANNNSVVWIARDITTRKRAEEKLRQAESK
ncbi:MAG TPA: PAS domain S-box protein, partial [Abditibacteriaceae bacterium]